jgi:CelD/BcsL family acetyltransferase involved in cellulose biosynthesis
LRVLQPVGVGGDTTPEYLDPLALPEQALELAPLLADFVLQLTGWDELRVPDLRAEFPFHAALEHASRRRGLPVQVLPVSQLCYVTLPESWPAYLASLSGDRRQKLKWMRKKFMELPGARFYALAERERLDAVIDRLIELHHMRWHGRGTQAFSSSAYLNFHRDVMHGFWDAGHLRLYCLEVDGAIAMIFYCYSLGGIIYHMQTGFDPAWSKSSPGHVMIGCLIENAISEGARGFDMLAGQNAFKLNYAREVRATRTVVVARSWKARLTFTARAIRTRLRRGPPAPAAD